MVGAIREAAISYIQKFIPLWLLAHLFLSYQRPLSTRLLLMHVPIDEVTV